VRAKARAAVRADDAPAAEASRAESAAGAQASSPSAPEKKFDAPAAANVQRAPSNSIAASVAPPPFTPPIAAPAATPPAAAPPAAPAAAARLQSAPRPFSDARDADVAQERRADTSAAAPMALRKTVTESDPVRELERIATLRAEGRDEEADRALEAFRKAHPDHVIPSATWERVRRQR
jgi:hypothetical protein